MQKVYLLILIFSAVILFFIWSSVSKNVETPHTDPSSSVALLVNDIPISVELSDTFSKRIQGLSGRLVLKEGEGMLFVFEKPDFHGIWMKDMHFPIDILWIDESLSVVDIKKNALPESYPEVFMPKKRAKYVLEVNTGFVEAHAIEIGDSMEL